MRECFDLGLSDTSKKLIEHLDNYGTSRYYESPFHVQGYERFDLDRAVWEIRRYCRVFDRNQSVREKQLKEIESDRRPPNKIRLQGGFLEKVLTDLKGKHPARAALVYQNPYFGVRSRKRVKVGGLHAGNSPLSLYPAMLDEVCKYALLPKRVVDASRARSGVGGCELWTARSIQRLPRRSLCCVPRRALPAGARCACR